MELSTRLRGQIWKTQDWLARVVELEWGVKRLADPWERSRQAYELGLLSESLVPDRERALAFYRLAWQATGDNLPALTRARRLYFELGDLEAAARLAEVEHGATGDPRLLAIAGECWLDAGERARASELFERARGELGDDEELADLTATAACAGDVAAQVTRFERDADAAGDPRTKSRKLLCAALLVRLANPSHPRIESLLRGALEEDPHNERAAVQLELALEREKRWIEFIELHELRAETAPSDRQRVDLYRRGGMALTVRHQQMRPGARMMLTALSVAYERGLDDVPGHLAMISLLRNAFQSSGRLGEVTKLCEQALEGPLSEDERLFISALAGRILWKGLKEPSQARRHFGTVKSIVPDHPLVAKFERVTGQRLTRVPRLAEAEEFARRAVEEVEQKMGGITTRRYLELARNRAEREERRAHPRAAASEVIKVDITAPEGGGGEPGGFRAYSRDLSEGGVFVVTERTVEPGAYLELQIRIPRSEGWEQEVFELRARVVRCEEAVGFGAELLSPPERYRERIRQLVERQRPLGV